MLETAAIVLFSFNPRKVSKRCTEGLLEHQDRLFFRYHSCISKAQRAGRKFASEVCYALDQKAWAKRSNSRSVPLTMLRAMLLKEVVRSPNNRHFSVPSDNLITRAWGPKHSLNCKIRDHTAIGKEVGVLACSGTKVSGARFGVMRYPVSCWNRMLTALMIETQAKEHRYMELSVPSIVTEQTLYLTGHLPKFNSEMFRVVGNGLIWYLIPTSEVVLANQVRGVTSSAPELPLRLAAHSPCFRLDQNVYGRFNRGLLRQRQFDKIEIMQISTETNSYRALDEVLKDAEVILQKLGLHYRVLNLGVSETGITSTKTFDIEVWFPSFGGYKEVSSCSNTESFQAKRLQAKHQLLQDKQLVHIINGSGLAVGRTLAAMLENNQ